MVAYFLPAVGQRNRRTGDVRNLGVTGVFWSSTPNDTSNAWNLAFNSTVVNAGTHNISSRAWGMSVRCVQELTEKNQV